MLNYCGIQLAFQPEGQSGYTYIGFRSDTHLKCQDLPTFTQAGHGFIDHFAISARVFLKSVATI